MRHKRISSRILRLVISALFFIVAVIVYFVKNPVNSTMSLLNLLEIIATLVLAVGAGQAAVVTIDKLLDFFVKLTEDDIPPDLRDKILANQYRLWVDGILRRSIENDPLIVPYNEIRDIKLDEKNKVNKVQFETDLIFSKKIQEKISQAGKRSSRQNSAISADGYKKIIDAYIASSGQLVILGEGGSGKTIALLQLFEHLHNEAKRDSRKYIPAVFNLGSWEEKQLNLTEWLVSELLDSFPEGTTEGLSRVFTYQVKRQKLVFLFDGLDEISKSGRYTFYNELLEFSGKVRGHSIQFVICSRPEEYAETQAYADGLLNPKAILLRPIDDEAITQFLAGDDYEQIRKIIFGMGDKGITKLLSSRNAEQIRKDIRKKYHLYEPAHHPFILNALAVGYKNPPEKDIVELESVLKENTHMLTGDGLQPIPEVILERYVSQRFDNAEAGDYELYNQEATNEYLSWVVQKLSDTVEAKTKVEDKAIRTEISIEKLQPTWLDNDKWRLAYSVVSRMLSTAAIAAGVGFILASPLDYLIAGMLAGVVIGVLDYATTRPVVKKFSNRVSVGWFRVIRFLVSLSACWITLSIYLGLITSAPYGDKIFGRIAISGITLAWFLSIFIAVIYSTREFRLKLGDVEPAEILRFEIGTMSRYALIGGISIGVFVGAFAQVLLTTQTSSTGIWLARIIGTMGIGWIGAAMIGFLAGAFFGGLFAGVFGLLSVSSIQEYERTRPNQGIRKSILNAFRVGLSLTVVFSGIFFVPLWFTYHDSDVIFRAIRNGLTIGVLGGLWSGGISTIHQIVLRFFLFISGRIPWDISRFLRYCSQINIMREIGGSYKFGHEYVRLYYSKDKVSETRPRWVFIIGALSIFMASFGLGSLRQTLNTSFYSFNVPTQYKIGYPVTLDVFVQENQKVTIMSRGVIRTGDYVGYVTPEGTEFGIFGIGQGGAFNTMPGLPNNVLMCKLDTETEMEWRACANPPKSNGYDVFFPMPWQTREANFIAPKAGYLQFDTNDNEPEKRKGAFFVIVTIGP